jgi:hypothetical protein
VHSAAERVAGAIRSKLLGFRSGLQGLERRLQLGTMLLQATVNSGRRGPPGVIADSEESFLSAIALMVAAFIAISTLMPHSPRIGVPISTTPVLRMQPAPDLEAKVATVAQAIAYAEGFYARGKHEGHSLPHVLNNPGSLKKPALAATNLPTWKDTGLVMFPNEQMGWDALKYQVRLMLTGHSSVYHLNDTIAAVASKYADGDANWGVNVARTLHVEPRMTLAEIAAHADQHSGILDSLRSFAALYRLPNTLNK